MTIMVPSILGLVSASMCHHRIRETSGRNMILGGRWRWNGDARTSSECRCDGTNASIISVKMTFILKAWKVQTGWQLTWLWLVFRRHGVKINSHHRHHVPCFGPFKLRGFVLSFLFFRMTGWSGGGYYKPMKDGSGRCIGRTGCL
jgi:hypothetical protein